MSQAVQLLQTLIRNACVNDGTPGSGHEHRSVATLEEFFDAPGERFEVAPGRTSVVYRIPGTNPTAPALLLMGHTDVVPANDEAWSRDPFGGTVSDGFVWGRGAVDMLNLLSAMAVAFRPYLAGDLDPPPGDVVFAAVADEENAGGLGAAPLVEDRWDLVACDFLLTEIAYPPMKTASGIGYPVSVGEKGPHWTRLHAEGVPGHGSVPHGSINAIEPMVEALHGVFSTPAPVLITDQWRSQVELLWGKGELADALVDPDAVDEAIERIALDDPRLAAYVHACTHMTISPNVLTAGTKANVVPDSAEAQVDVRVLPGQSRADVDTFLSKAMGARGDRIRLDPVADHPANASEMTDPLWLTVVDAIEQQTGSRLVVPTLMPATTDARFFRSKGVAAYGVGLFDDRVSFPDFLTMFHGNDERVSVESVDRTTTLMETILLRWCERWA